MAIAKKQRGFAMLEVALAVVIIAIASFGVYKLYASSLVNSTLAEEENLISRICSEINHLAYINNRYPNTEELYNSGFISTGTGNAWPSTGSPITAPFGPIYYGYDGAARTYSYLYITGIPNSIANLLLYNLYALGDVYFMNRESTYDPKNPPIINSDSGNVYVWLYLRYTAASKDTTSP